jgi:hypothetical protein
MNYLREINAFYDWLETNPLSTSGIALWYALMHINNKAGWAKEFAVAVSVLCIKTGLSSRTVYDARNELKTKGRLDWRSRKGNQSAIYELFRLCAIDADNGADNGSYKASDNGAVLIKPETKQKGNNIPPKFPADSPEMSLALKLQTLILKNNDKARVPKDLTGWAVEFDKMIRIDGRPIDQLTAVMKFSQESTFWASNILSAKKLREKYDTLYLQSKAQPRGHPPGDLARTGTTNDTERKKQLIKKLYLT